MRILYLKASSTLVMLATLLFAGVILPVVLAIGCVGGACQGVGMWFAAVSKLQKKYVELMAMPKK